jgi:hypothetical protein
MSSTREKLLAEIERQSQRQAVAIPVEPTEVFKFRTVKEPSTAVKTQKTSSVGEGFW